MSNREAKKRPRILILGEEVPWDEVEGAATAAEPMDYFAPVRISPKAIDRASQLVPEKYYKPQGLHTWISERANHVFKNLAVSKNEGKFRGLKYFFEYDADGPVLKNISEAV